MPRHAREKSDIGIFHIILRGINKQTIFEDDEDRERFIETVERFKAVSKYEIYAYCLMSNHVHLLLKENKEPISAAIKRISASYVYWYNSKYGRCGHLFQERYKSEVIEDDAYLLTALRYIHQNPVKAGIARDSQDYKWSSYNDYIKKPTITDVGYILDIFSTNRERALALFIEHNNKQNNDKCLDNEEKVRLSDHEVREYFEKVGIWDISKIRQLERDRRNEIIRTMKIIDGVTVRQLSKLTGISKSVIDRI